MKKIKNIPGMYKTGGESNKRPTFIESVKLFLKADSWKDYTNKINKKIAESDKKDTNISNIKMNQK